MLRFTRRQTLLGIGLIALAPVIQACGQPAAPTPAPAKPAPVAPAAPAAAAKPAEKAAAPQAAVPVTSQQKVPLSIAVWTDSVRTWMTDRSNEFAKQHPEVELKQESVPYADMSQKQLAYAATGTIMLEQ